MRLKTLTVPLILILAAGFFVRFFLAPIQGFTFDIDVNQGWAYSAVELGLGDSYWHQLNGNMLPNYPPLSMIIFALSGYAYRFISPEFDLDLPAFDVVIKLPGIIADLVTAALLAFLVTPWKGKRAGLLAATIYTFHPAVIYESSVWGQTDSIFTLFIVAALAACAYRNWDLSVLFIALSFFLKVQAVAVAPLFLYLYARSLKHFLRMAVIGGLTLILVILPFIEGGGVDGILRVYLESAGYYPSVSMSAYNFWWGLFSDASGDTSDTDIQLGLLSYRSLGVILWLTLSISSIDLLRKYLPTLEKCPAKKLYRPKPEHLISLFMVASLLAFGFFLFNTEMHERYLFPFVALGLPLVFLGALPAVLYACITAAFTMNLFGVLSFGGFDRALYNEFPALDVFIAVSQVWLFILFFAWAVTYFRRASIPPRAS